MSNIENNHGAQRHRRAVAVLPMLTATVLICAAGLKIRSNSPYSQNSVVDGVFSVVIVAEVILGMWLLSGFCEALSRKLTIFAFCLFAAASFVSTLLGSASCGCLGEVAIDPVWMLFFDAVMVIVWVFAPHGSQTEVPREAGRKSVAKSVVSISIGLGVLITIIRGPDAFDDSPRLGMFGSLKMGDLEGVPLELIEDIDIGMGLRTGSWVLVFHRAGCANCELVLNDPTLPETYSARYGEINVATIAIQASDSNSHAAFFALPGKLKGLIAFRVRTPLVLVLREGAVLEATVVEADQSNVVTTHRIRQQLSLSRLFVQHNIGDGRPPDAHNPRADAKAHLIVDTTLHSLTQLPVERIIVGTRPRFMFPKPEYNRLIYPIA